jgi:imidazolonepropionase-like amidohydrolase
VKALLLLGLLLPWPGHAADLLLRDVHILDPAHAREFQGSVLVQAGVIQTVYPGELPADVTATTVLDLHGKWLLPGLHDLHVHGWGNQAPIEGEAADQDLGLDGTARRMLYAGVTALLDLGSAEDATLALRDRQRRGDVPGAEIHCAGPVWLQLPHKSKGMHFARVVTGPADARRQVAEFAKKHSDVLKIIYDHSGTRPGMDRRTLQALVHTAKRHGLPVVVHISTWQDLREATEAGATAVTHLDDAGPIPPELVALLKSRKTVEIPTLGVQMGLGDLVHQPALLDDPLFIAETTPVLRASYRDPEQFGRKGRFWLKWQTGSRPLYLESVKRLFAAGVTVLPGADSGNIGVVQGWSTHRELQLFAEAGVPPWQVLAAATVQAGAFLGRKVGMQPADIADFLVLRANPLQDMGNTRAIDAVIQRGRVVDRQAMLR